MHCADGAAAERRQILFECGVMIALLYVALLLCWWLLMVHWMMMMTRRWVMGRLTIMMLFYLFALVCSCALGTL
jgi:hypothetical protein